MWSLNWLNTTKDKILQLDLQEKFQSWKQIIIYKKTLHNYGAQYKTRLRGIKKGCEWRLREITNKNKNSTPKISLINNIVTLPNSSKKYILAIAE